MTVADGAGLGNLRMLVMPSTGWKHTHCLGFRHWATEYLLGTRGFCLTLRVMEYIMYSARVQEVAWCA